MDIDETIVAIASSQEGSHRGIVRVSGPSLFEALDGVFGSEGRDWRESKQAERIPGKLALGEPLGDVPCDLYLWPGTQSYTRQPTAELHTLGALPLLEVTTQTLCRQSARLAKPGEFTLRAFLAGRLDLAQAEAVLGVIDAVDQRQLDVALAQLAGGLTRPLSELRDRLLNLCADLEAGLDFVEEDISFISPAQLCDCLAKAESLIRDTLSRMSSRHAGETLPHVVLRGRPNVGKSSIWNALVSDARAIVTEQAGTTRDYLSGTVRRHDVAFTLIDTAGAETAAGDALQDSIDSHTQKQVDQADLLLLCFDSTRPLDGWERQEFERTESAARLILFTKADLPPCKELLPVPDILTSVFANKGIDQLVWRCQERLQSLAGESSVVAATAVRCNESLRGAHEAVLRAHELAISSSGDELIAAELRTALESLGEVVGAIYTDDVLDRVFARFCIGK